MKRPLALLIALLNFASPSFAMLDDPLVEGYAGWGAYYYKDLLKGPPPQGNHRSPIYGPLAENPKAPVVHSYNGAANIRALFSAALNEAHPSYYIEDIHSQYLPEYQKTFSFVVQSIEPGGAHHSLKPHYGMHPEAKRVYDGVQNFEDKIRWTAIPGIQGQVVPELGTAAEVGLLANTIYTHPDVPVDADDKPTGPPQVGRSSMLLSGDSEHIRGIDPANSVDFTSLFAFEKGGNKAAAITYHWLLNNADLALFTNALRGAHTFRDLIHNLEPIVSFHNLVGELKRYVGFFPRQEEVSQIYNNIKKQGNPLSDEVIVKYILEDKIRYPNWDGLVPADRAEGIAQIVSRSELKNLEGLLDGVTVFYSSIKKQGNPLSDEAIIKYILEDKMGYRNWDRLLPADKAGGIAHVVSKSELKELDALLDPASQTYRSIKAAGNPLPDEAIVKYVLEEKGYKNWGRLTPADKAQFIAKIR